jgi:alcohol dehydrogenase, propanol-preferring
MRAAVLHRFGEPLVLEERTDPRPCGEEVLMRVAGVGVCHSDLHIVARGDQQLPLVLGHEIAGESAGLGMVLVYPAWGCGTCTFCAEGEEQLCSDGQTAGFERDGGYAEYVVVPNRRYLLPLEGIDPVRAAPLADAALTPYRAVRRARPWLERGGRAVVIGVGGLGQFAVQYLKLTTDAHVIAVDVTEQKRARALELGADDAAPPAELEAEARVVLDFVGSNDSLALAAATVRRQGLVIQTGAGGGSLTVGLDHGWPQEAQLTTNILGSLDDLRAVLELTRRGELKWHVETLPLERANEALDRLRRGDVVQRLVLTP